jgi:metallophosphoesterase (TIGR00282 family)
VKILFIGDVVGKPGRDAVRRAIRPLIARHDIDVVVANAENVAGGFGVTRDTLDDLLSAGVEMMTSGNHVWDKKEILNFIDGEPRLLRPANFPAGVPGRGRASVACRNGGCLGVVNVMGRVFMAPLDDPVAVVDREIAALKAETDVRVILVDFHAEATSEKVAMGWHLDGRVAAVVGTHTHVQTADARLLPKGTAYITDVGMTGPHDSIIGVDPDAVLARFRTGMPSRFETARGNPRLQAVVIDADPATGRATAIERLDLGDADLHHLIEQTRQTS